jgi:DNA-binding SARP family transcriptional activator/Flp pilus assembly protein TadD
MSFSLKLLGGVALAGDRGALSGPAVQRHRLALLALLAIARPRAVSRDKLMASLWPERDSEPARRLLNQAVHTLRQALGAEVLVSAGEDLRLDTCLLPCDVTDFEDALAAHEPERAVALYGGPFLDGFFLDEAPEFEHWVERERGRLSVAYAKALETLAEAAEVAGDSSRVVERWTVRAAHDPLDSRVALRLMQALEKSGNRAGALQHAASHRQLLREELEIEPSPEVQAMVERLRQEPAPSAPRLTAVSRPAVSHRPTPLPDEVAAGATLDDLRQVGSESAPTPSRTAWYAAAAVLLLALIGGAFRLAARGGERHATATLGVAPPATVDEIARAVAKEIERRQRGDTAVRLSRHRTHSIPAYELFLRGDDPALVRSDSGARRGLEYFRQAVALDSSYAAAWVGLARMTYRASERSVAARAKARVQSEAAVRKALALDDSLAEAHALLGVYAAADLDWATAERHFRRAISLEPARSRTREWFVQFLLLTGRREEALAEAERMLVLDPMSPAATAELARVLAANHRCQEALVRLETIQALDPPLLRTAPIAARCYAQLGRWAEAIAALRAGAERDSSGNTLAMLGYMRGRAGERAAALSIHARLLERWRTVEDGAMNLAYVPAALGDRDQAFAWIDSAFQEGSLRYAPGFWADLTDVPFDALAADPRMEQLWERFGLQKR